MMNERRPRYRTFAFRAPQWIIDALLDEADRNYTPAAVYLVTLLRKHFQQLGYGPKEGEQDERRS